MLAGQGTVELTVGEVAIGQSIWPIESASFDVSAQADGLRAHYTIHSCEGKAVGDIALIGGSALQVNWHISELKLEKTLESVQRTESGYVGMLSSQCNFEATVNAIPQTIQGQGTLDIDRGKLVKIPVIRELVSVASKVGYQDKWPNRDKARASFDLVPHKLNLNSLEVTSPLIYLEGNGEIHYNGQLDLITKVVVFDGVTRHMGLVGDWLNKLTDNFVSYRVRGTWHEPSVAFRPLGVLSDLPAGPRGSH